MSFLSSTADRIFSHDIYKYAQRYSNLQSNIRKAHIPVPVESYVSRAYLYSILIGIIAGVIGFLAVMYILDIKGAPVVNFGTGTLSVWMEVHIFELTSLAAGIVASLVFFRITYLVYNLVPAVKSSVNQSAIDRSLPHAVSYMYGLSRGGGMNLFDIFKSLSGYSHVYGASAEEVGYVVRDMSYLGQDLLTALGNATIRTSSEKYKDFIDGLVSIVSSGGDTTAYLKNKTEQYRLISSIEQKFFMEKLGMLAEVYISIFVVGPLFLVTILVVLGIIGSTATQLLYFVIYIMIPFGSLLFLLVLEVIVGGDEKLTFAYKTKKKLNVFNDINVKPESEDDIKRIRQMYFYEKLSGFIYALSHPFKNLSEKPANTFYLTIPIGLGILLPIIYAKLASEGVNLHDMLFNVGNVDIVGNISQSIFAKLDNYVFYYLLIILFPYIFFYELRSRRINRIEDQIPEFIKRLASINEAGILLIDAIALVARSKIGILHSEISRVVEDISWGTNLSDALQKFEYRVRTDMTARIITLIIKASESTNDVRSVLSIAATDANIQKQLKKERSNEMLIYVFIIYIAFFVFLFIIYVLAVNFLSNIPSSLDEVAEGMPMVADFNIDEYTMLFFHASMIQGFCSGLIAGKMGSGHIAAGLKHSMIMMLIAYSVFTFLI
jgi:flagellar protein FlaJ